MENFMLDLVSYIKKTTYCEENATYRPLAQEKRWAYNLKSKITSKKQIMGLLILSKNLNWI